MFSSIPGIGNVLLVCLVFWLIFSILGVQLFAGKFYKCLDSEGNRLPASEVPDKVTCLSYNGTYTWINSNVNFDNVANGFLALFQMVRFLQFSMLKLQYPWFRTPKGKLFGECTCEWLIKHNIKYNRLSYRNVLLKRGEPKRTDLNQLDILLSFL